MDQREIQNQAIGVRVSMVSILVNVLLTAFKLFAGVVAHSGALLSDAVHSASDIVSTVVVIIGLRLSSKQSDDEHPYGHERIECVAAIGLSGLLLLTGLSIGIGGVRTILGGLSGTFVVPGKLALAAALISIGTKEWLYQYTKRAAKKTGSSSLMADAWHHRSDAISSIGALIGIGFSIAGYPIMDSIACILISLLIVKVSFDIAREAINQMLDSSCPREIENALAGLAGSESGVMRVDSLKTRRFGSRYYVDIETSVDGPQPVKEGHDIASRVHHRVEREFPGVKHCMVHVNPYAERRPIPKDKL